MMFVIRVSLAAALLTGAMHHAIATSLPPTSVRTESSVENLALEWYGRMQSGHIDRTQLAPAYSAQLTADAVQALSRHLKADNYGVSPTGARVLEMKTVGDQAFYVVKLIFPRGDAAGLLIGLDAEGKITGISFLSMAGD